LKLPPYTAGVTLNKWWDTKPSSEYLTGGTETIGIADTLEFLFKWIAEEESKNGPFDGVLGYSQGGVLASYLCALASAPDADGNHDLKFGFKFGIFFCAFKLPAQPYAQVYRQIKEAIPTLHVWGQNDPLVPANYSKELAHSFSPSSVTYSHSGGHVVPSNSPAKEAYLSFLQQFISQE